MSTEGRRAAPCRPIRVFATSSAIRPLQDRDNGHDRDWLHRPFRRTARESPVSRKRNHDAARRRMPTRSTLQLLRNRINRMWPPPSRFAELSLSSRVIWQAIRWRKSWVWEEAHCFGCSASRCRSSFCSRCSGITDGSRAMGIGTIILIILIIALLGGFSGLGGGPFYGAGYYGGGGLGLVIIVLIILLLMGRI